MPNKYKRRDKLDQDQDYIKENQAVYNEIKWPWIAEFIKHENLDDHLSICNDGKIVDSQGYAVCDFIDED